MLRPGEFIGAAEHSGLIIPIGQKVLHEACEQMKQWVTAGIAPRSVSVNISAIQFKAPLELEQTIITALRETGLPPECLELELTETVLMETSFEHNDVLQRLREKGIRLAIDDFGTGFSSFDYLRRYPVSRIKMSQHFVRGSLHDASDAAIVKAIIGLARELNVEFIAEGVETAEQLEQLRAWGCCLIQGYYFARPMPSGEVGPLLADGVIHPALPETSPSSRRSWPEPRSSVPLHRSSIRRVACRLGRCSHLSIVRRSSAVISSSNTPMPKIPNPLLECRYITFPCSSHVLTPSQMRIRKRVPVEMGSSVPI